MDSQLTSESKLKVFASSGAPVSGPEDWQSALVCIDVPPEHWLSVRVTRQGAELPVALRVLHGTPRIIAEWPRSGPGRYELSLFIGHELAETLRLTIKPAKISEAALEQLIDDLQTRLPAAIALGLQRLGALTGLRLLPPNLSTRAQELQRLTRAVNGHDGRPGLVQILADVTRDPHHVLQRTEAWRPIERAKHPVASKLAQALGPGQNLRASGVPGQIVDAVAEQSYDTYENRLVKSFEAAVRRRIARLARSLAQSSRSDQRQIGDCGDLSDALGLTLRLRERLVRARAQASFLDRVSDLSRAPDRVSMVLLNRPAYRAALEGYYEFLRSVWIRLDEPALDAPLENFPYLYEIWGTLHILSALLDASADLGYIQRGGVQLAARDTDGLYVRLLPNGSPAVVLYHPSHRTEIRLIPQRSYGKSGSIRSTTFTQVPDVAVEVYPEGGPPRVYLFDPKYKLESDQTEYGGDGSPRKEDIDKMHAYRDALRGEPNERVVAYAAILYPGSEVSYPKGEDMPDVAALTADPGNPGSLTTSLRKVLEVALRG